MPDFNNLREALNNAVHPGTYTLANQRAPVQLTEKYLKNNSVCRQAYVPNEDFTKWSGAEYCGLSPNAQPTSRSQQHPNSRNSSRNYGGLGQIGGSVGSAGSDVVQNAQDEIISKIEKCAEDAVYGYSCDFGLKDFGKDTVRRTKERTEEVGASIAGRLAGKFGECLIKGKCR